MTRTLLAALAIVLVLAGQAPAECEVAVKGKTCSKSWSIATATTIRELTTEQAPLRSSLCAIAHPSNTANMFCGPIPVTTTDGVPLIPGSWYCWNDKVGNSEFFADADIGCVPASGTQTVVSTENYP